MSDVEFTPQRFRIEKDKWENLPVRHGFFVNTTFKENLDQYYIAAVQKGWDGVLLVTGMEGSGKSTTAFTIAKYCDYTFPGELLNNGTSRRSCDRIVFTTKQFGEAVESSSPGQAIVWDEFILGGFASDALTQMQKELIKLMVTIRKKNLYIILVVPNIFLLRKYFVIARSRALVHQYTPDGIKRGMFKFFSYDRKRQLYIKGCKEWDMGAVQPDFTGESINTLGYFFDGAEYEEKKDTAIKQITEEPEKKKEEMSNKRKKIFEERNDLLLMIYNQWKVKNMTGSNDAFRLYMNDRFNWENGVELYAKSLREARERVRS